MNNGKDGKFVKGNCANPNGRPKKNKAFAELVRERLNEEEEGTGKTKREVMFEELWQGRKSGNTQYVTFCYKLLVEYDSGKPVQRVIEEREEQEDLDLSKLSDDELKQLIELKEKAKRRE